MLDETGQAILDLLNSVIVSAPTVVDNCTTADPTKALSANQGKVLNDKINSVATLLWTNPNKSTGFSARTVSLDLTGYKAVVVMCVDYCGSQSRWTLTSTMTPIDEYGIVVCPYIDGSKLNNFSARKFTVSSTGIAFDSGYNQSASNDNNAVPFYIYGIK